MKHLFHVWQFPSSPRPVSHGQPIVTAQLAEPVYGGLAFQPARQPSLPTFEKTGSIPFDPKIDSIEPLSHFGKCLQGIGANDLCVSGNQLTFSGGAFRFVTILDPLYYFASADLTVDPLRHVVGHRVNYQQLM
jgi:hypothetical protein